MDVGKAGIADADQVAELVEVGEGLSQYRPAVVDHIDLAELNGLAIALGIDHTTQDEGASGKGMVIQDRSR